MQREFGRFISRPWRDYCGRLTAIDASRHLLSRFLLRASLALALAGCFPVAQAQPSQPELRTRAELTGYAETSRYDGVMAFLHAVECGWYASGCLPRFNYRFAVLRTFSPRPLSAL